MPEISERIAKVVDENCRGNKSAFARAINVKRSLNQELDMMVTTLMNDADESFKKRFVAALLQVPPEGWDAIEEFVNKLSTAEKEPRSD